MNNAKLLDRLANMKIEKLDKATVRNAKIAILHSLACIAESKNSSINKSLLNNSLIFSKGEFPILFYENRYTFMDAIYLNSYLSQSTLLEDIHVPSNSHPGIIIIPATLITALKEKSSGVEVIEAVIKGYQIMGELGSQLDHSNINKCGFRPTSILGVFGSSLATASLLKLDETKTMQSLGLAASMAAGLNTWPKQGTDELYLQNGNAAKNGVFASYLINDGMKAVDNVFIDEKGFFNAYGLNQNYSLSENIVIDTIKYKKFPACALIQSAGLMGQRIRNLGINLKNVSKIEIKTHSLGLNYPGCNHIGPYNSELSARMSNQYLISTILINGKPLYSETNNPHIAEVASKINVKEDKEITEKFPDKQKMKGEITLLDNTKIEIEIEDAEYISGDIIQAQSLAVFKKFLGEHEGECLFNSIMNIEFEKNMDFLLKIFK